MLGEEEGGGGEAVVCWLRIVFSRPCICNKLFSRLIAADMGGEGGGVPERFHGKQRELQPISSPTAPFGVQQT